jgi:hypothetical protein
MGCYLQSRPVTVHVYKEWGLLSWVSEADIIDVAEHHETFYLNYLGSPQQYEVAVSMVTKITQRLVSVGL